MQVDIFTVARGEEGGEQNLNIIILYSGLKFENI